MNAHIVVGCGYGDEGKGLTVDYLCSKLSSPIVVRFSGGQQAGHTVRIGEQIHTHSNFGAGTLRGYPSYFTEHTCIYPLTMMRERKVLENKGIEPEVIYHPLAMVTTPFDRWDNRNDVTACGHGTCGLGIGKTMKRNGSPVKLHAIDLLNVDVTREKLEAISKWYNLQDSEDEWLIKEVIEFLEAIAIMPLNIQGYDFLLNYDNIIFEGSQGVLLDMIHGVFPHVTYANTTSKNAQEVCDKLDIPSRNRTVYHITRAYHTRHGNGFFESQYINIKNNKDENNKYNEWQKEFKVAHMNYDLLNHAIKVETIYSWHCTKVFVITCNDQVEEPFDMLKLAVGYNTVFKSNSSDSSKMSVHSRFEEHLID